MKLTKKQKSYIKNIFHGVHPLFDYRKLMKDYPEEALSIAQQSETIHHMIFGLRFLHAEVQNKNMFNNSGEMNASSLKDALQTLVKYAAILEENTP